MSGRTLRDEGKEPVERETPPHRRSRATRRRLWAVEHHAGRGWMAPRGWTTHGRYEKERDAREAYGALVKKGDGGGSWLQWSYRLLDPDGAEMERWAHPEHRGKRLPGDDAVAP